MSYGRESLIIPRTHVHDSRASSVSSNQDCGWGFVDDVADALFDEYGEAAGGGIRAGKQDPVFQGGNEYLRKNFPKLDYIRTARIAP